MSNNKSKRLIGVEFNDIDPAALHRAATLVYEGYENYNRQFIRITDRARRRFEQQDWKGQIQDIGERVELYDKWCLKIRRRLKKEIGKNLHNRQFWNSLREYFGSRLENVPEVGFMKTFYNSICRRHFGTIGTDPELEFIQPPPDEGLESLAKRRYPCWHNLEDSFRRVLKDFRFRIYYQDVDRDIEYMAKQVENFIKHHGLKIDDIQRLEFIDSHFYQGARAYLVGRVMYSHESYPIVIALENSGQGVSVDAILLEESQVTVIFSYTRSYYFADPTSVVGAVQFLHSILPKEPIDELYTVLGRLRQGKTRRFRVFANHLKQTTDNFVHADGDAGLVMQVFTLNSFNLVFKVIRDKFGYPKNTTREEVMDKYRLVANHDHAGRLIDTQVFRNLKLPIDRFESGLLAELLEGTADTVHVEDNDLVFNNIYIERRVRPLNLYIREASEDLALAAILDYGQAIKDLAETNIFPGDLLLKNFGVTASGRVVFYDYDEVALVTECRFRELPEPNDDDFDLMDTGMTTYIAPNDIFPEEFIKFLAMPGKLRKTFLEIHGDMLTAEYWRNVKARRLTGEITHIIPYRKTQPK